MTERLIYPRPANRDLELHTALHELQENEDIFRKFLEDPDAVVGRFDLDDEARALLRDRDYQGMVNRGVHPILVVQLQRNIDWGMNRSRDEPRQG